MGGYEKMGEVPDKSKLVLDTNMLNRDSHASNAAMTSNVPALETPENDPSKQIGGNKLILNCEQQQKEEELKANINEEMASKEKNVTFSKEVEKINLEPNEDSTLSEQVY